MRHGEILRVVQPMKALLVVFCTVGGVAEAEPLVGSPSTDTFRWRLHLISGGAMSIVRFDDESFPESQVGLGVGADFMVAPMVALGMQSLALIPSSLSFDKDGELKQYGPYLSFGPSIIILWVDEKHGGQARAGVSVGPALNWVMFDSVRMVWAGIYWSLETGYAFQVGNGVSLGLRLRYENAFFVRPIERHSGESVFSNPTLQLHLELGFGWF